MLTITHRPPATDPHPAWYVSCPECGWSTLGERLYIETLAGTACPVCEVVERGTQLWLGEDENGDWVVMGDPS